MGPFGDNVRAAREDSGNREHMPFALAASLIDVATARYCAARMDGTHIPQFHSGTSGEPGDMIKKRRKCSSDRWRACFTPLTGTSEVASFEF
eukprot:3646831-Amphidinium_carterae.1